MSQYIASEPIANARGGRPRPPATPICRTAPHCAERAPARSRQPPRPDRLPQTRPSRPSSSRRVAATSRMSAMASRLPGGLRRSYDDAAADGRASTVRSGSLQARASTAARSNRIASPSTIARTVSPSAKRPSSSSSASGFSTSRWIARFSGRAPNGGSQPGLGDQLHRVVGQLELDACARRAAARSRCELELDDRRRSAPA